MAATDGRRARSERTRAAVVAGATRRFLAHGYVGSTIEDVAAEAGVAVQTVYYVFGNKPTLLAAVLDASIAGETDGARQVIDQSWVDDLREARDAGSAVRLLAEASVAIVVRAAPIYDVVRRAASDPDVGALLEQNRRNRRADQRRLVEILSAAGHLHPAIDVTVAADVLYAVVNEEMVALLAHDCGWSAARLTTWVGALLEDQLVAGRAVVD